MTKKTTEIDLAIRGEFLQQAELLMEETPVMLVHDLERKMYDHFKDRFTKLHLSEMVNKIRTRWQNLVDHCKAHWTRRDMTQYLVIGRDRYIVWLPTVGSVKGSHLMEYSFVIHLVNTLADVVDEKIKA